MSAGEPSAKELAAAQGATVDQLDKPSAAEVNDKTANRILNAEADRQDQANKLRERFFWSVTGAMSFALVSSVLVMGAYIWSEFGDVQIQVMIAWLSATVVETIGLAYIIANYLFPKDSQKGDSAPSATIAPE
ncbi:hypothetical protein [Litorihabitans aurantiacus]|uniref:Uncharacterized protein n=1 Tax=Litorihabitans aurantiacus TaxID=1930061 RepID=A0AA37XIB6_9MICO|nr:hypothetical protein [Litorihabitans aurantiacus]GMA33541.1 hypothetical protein GCM10025875_35330 [Litorihabitans aurantiacus]GMA33607.1 hypothetical protein GCM10025875_35990 [Litorihabitans aurantiacus]